MVRPARKEEEEDKKQTPTCMVKSHEEFLKKKVSASINSPLLKGSTTYSGYMLKTLLE